MSNTEQKPSIEERLVRIESRLVQLMYHLGLDPHVRTYDAPREAPIIGVGHVVG